MSHSALWLPGSCSLVGVSGGSTETRWTSLLRISPMSAPRPASRCHAGLFCKSTMSPLSPLRLRQPKQKANRLRHVDARQEWVQLLRNSNLFKNAHVDTFENLGDMNILCLYHLHRLSQAEMSTDSRYCIERALAGGYLVVQLRQLHIAEELCAVLVWNLSLLRSN